MCDGDRLQGGAVELSVLQVLSFPSNIVNSIRHNKARGKDTQKYRQARVAINVISCRDGNPSYNRTRGQAGFASSTRLASLDGWLQRCELECRIRLAWVRSSEVSETRRPETMWQQFRHNNCTMISTLSKTIALIGVGIALLVRHNPYWFGISQLGTAERIDEILAPYSPPAAAHPILDSILERYRDDGIIGADDYDKYRNHCRRVLAFASYFYEDGIECDAAASNQDEMKVKKKARDMDIMAFAATYHDIALWTDEKLDYLDPSVAVMERDIESGSVDDAISLSPTEKETAIQIILQHHKLTAWSATKIAPASSAATPGIEADALVVNAFRKADWADATVGLIRWGLPADLFEAAYTAIPEQGFHEMLANMGARLSPDSLVGQLDVLNILKW